MTLSTFRRRHPSDTGQISGELAADYYISAARDRSGWGWQIHRRSCPMGVKLCVGGFDSERSARLAGEKALRDFLERLTEELDVIG
jgi:hypothetical protein